MILNSPYISGSLTVTGNEVVTGSLTVLGGITGAITGSATSASYAANTSLLNNKDSGEFVATGSFNSYTSSNDATVTSVAAAAVSAVAGVNALAARTGSYTTTSSFNSYTASNNTTMSCVSSTATSAIAGVGALASQTGSYATTGSNTFVGGQYLSSSFNPTGFSTTASLYTDGGLRVTRDAYISGTLYLNNVTVFGTQSVAYISSSQLNIGTNLITVNTDTPSIRFGGLAVYDSGSTGLTGSILWDSETNHWIYSNPSGSTYSGGMFISGPRTSTLGSETGTTSCMLLAGQGGDHLTSSMIYHSSTVTCIPNTLIGSTVCTTMANASCIGIGTTTPTYDLTLSKSVAAGNVVLNIENTSTTGAARLWLGNNASSTGARIQYFGATHAARPNLFSIGTDAANDMMFETSGTERVRITSGGLVLIGTSTLGSPTGVTDLLTIGKSGSSSTGVNFTDGTSTRWGFIYANNAKMVYGSFTDVAFESGASSAERMRIASTGIACFACQVCAPAFVGGTVSGTTGTFSGSSTLLTLSSGAGTKAVFATTRNFGVNRNFQIAVDEFAESAFTITPSTTLGGSGYTTPIFTLAAAGTATFSNTVCAPYICVGRNAGGDTTNYSLSINRHGDLACSHAYTTVPAFIINELSNSGPTSGLVDVAGIWNLSFGRYSHTMACAKFASLMFVGYDGAMGPLRVDGRGNMFIGYDRTAANGSDAAFSLLVACGITAGSYQYCVPPSGGALFSGNVGIGCSSPGVSLVVGGTDALKLPTGTSAQRPTGAAGMVRMNTTTGQPEWYNTATSTWASFNQNVNSYTVEYLVVGGGGGGGYDNGAGGGAGGFVLDCGLSVSSCASYSVIIGAGGSATTGVSGHGGASCFNGVVALGGGGGGGQSYIGDDGGSGGGSMMYPSSGGFRGGFGTIGQGFEGGCWTQLSSPWIGSGGGGASQRGFDGPFNGMGGAGKPSTLLGNTCYYSGGGNGSGDSPGCQTQPLGGGGIAGNPVGGNGNTNSGGGGGGGINGGNLGGNGGSGIVIIRYPGCQRGSGGTICSYCGTTIHVFTSSGTFVA